jgi:ABC-type glycerol-3-phosphate transport system permease component
VPWRLIIAVIILIAGPAILVYLIMRRRFNKRLQKVRRKIV